MAQSYRIFAKGDVNAFFGLMFYNMSDLVNMAAILIARIGLPWRIPGALGGIVCGTVIVCLLGGLELLPVGQHLTFHPLDLRFTPPIPSLEFLPGLSRAIGLLPLAIPFALATVVGGVDVTESAAVADDRYDTRDILLVEGAATLLVGLCGGVIQSCPSIGHPDYKEMGGRAGYTLVMALLFLLLYRFGRLDTALRGEQP